MANIIAALDQGTTSTRCILFNQAGEIISSCQKEHQQIYPKPGWVEHDPIEIPQGIYEIWRQREYTPERIITVRD